jgi:ketosteroid isomerase-like protein
MNHRTFVVAAVLVVVTLLAACARSDPEKELRSTIAAMAQAVEQHQVGDVLDPVADDFTRESGAFGKQDARRLLAGAMLRNERIQLATTVTDVRIEGTRAFVKLRVIATGGAGLLPERGQTWEFDTVWRREQGRWKVFNAEWREGL